MKTKFETEPILYYKNKIKIHTARRDSYIINSKKWKKFDKIIKNYEHLLINVTL